MAVPDLSVIRSITSRRGWPQLSFLLLLLVAHLRAVPPALAAPLPDTPLCYNLLPNGSFEQDSVYWRLMDSPRPPAPSNAIVYDGAKAMRVGNDESLPNLASESEIRSQPVTLPANATTIILRFFYYPIHNAVPAENQDQDLQQALIYQVFDANDPKKDQLIEPIFNVQENDRQWKLREIPISNYRGRAISVVFRVKNDGAQGLTLMYVDRVEIIYCTLTPIPTSTATFTPTATATTSPTVTQPPIATATPVATLPPPPTATPRPVSPCMAAIPANNVCYNLLVNGGFEYQGDWSIGEDPVPPRYVSDQRHSGNQAILLGNPPGGPNVESYSSIRQWVTIPADATMAQLCFWRFYRSEDTLLNQPGGKQDRQEVIALGPNLEVLEVLDRVTSNDSGWQRQGIPLNHYIGRSFKVYFNAYNNASPQHTWAYLDDVELFYCTAAPPPVTATFTPAPIVTLAPTPVPPTPAPPTATAPAPPPASATAVLTAAVAAAAGAADPTQPPPALVTEEIVVVAPLAAPAGAVVAVVTPAPDSFVIANEQPAVTALPATLAPTPMVRTTPLLTAPTNIWWSRAMTVGILLGILALIGIIVFLLRSIWQMLWGRSNLDPR